MNRPKTKTQEQNIHSKSPKSVPSTSVVNSSISEFVYDESKFSNYNVFEKLWLKRDSLKMPNAEWALHYINKNGKKRILISECSVANDGAPSFLRNIILEHDSQLKAFIGSMEITKNLLKLSSLVAQPTNISDVQDYVNYFSNTVICAGGPSTKKYSLNKVHIKTAKIDVNGAWRHISCPIILNNSDRRCIWCKRVYDYFINDLLCTKS